MFCALCYLIIEGIKVLCFELEQHSYFGNELLICNISIFHISFLFLETFSIAFNFWLWGVLGEGEDMAFWANITKFQRHLNFNIILNNLCMVDWLINEMQDQWKEEHKVREITYFIEWKDEQRRYTSLIKFINYR